MNIIDDSFNAALNLTAKATVGVFSGAFNLTRRVLQNRKFNKKIQYALEKSCNNRKVAISSQINPDALFLNDDPEYSDIAEFDCPALNYILGKDGTPENMIISGGTNEKRLKALEVFINKSQNLKIPVVVIHNSNRNIYDVVRNNSCECEFISQNSDDCFYDIFAGITSHDIVRLIYDSIEGKPEQGTEALLDSLINVALEKSSRLSIHDIAYFPIDNLENEINSMFAQGIISKSKRDMLLNRYFAGAIAKDSVRFFLKGLATQFERTFGVKTSKSKLSNVKRMINRNGVIAIDVGNCNNEEAIKFMIRQLILIDTLMKTKDPTSSFNVVIDNIPIWKFNTLRDLLRDKVYAISSNDFIASVYNLDMLFNSLTSDIGLIILLKHPGISSCKKWSEYLGQYRKITMLSDLAEHGTFLNFSPGRNLRVNEEDKPRIKDITIANLPDNVACVYKSEGILISEI